MIFKHINKIAHPHARRAAKGAVRAHLIMLKLIALKTIIFNIFSLKVLVAESAILMSIFSLVPHVQVINAATTVDYSISNITFPVQSAPGDTVVFSYYFQSQDPGVQGSSVVVQSDIPEGFTYLSASANPIVDQGKNTVTRNIPAESNLQGMVIVRFTVDEDAPPTVTNTVTVSHAGDDPVPANNQASATILIGGQGTIEADADLVLQKTVNNDNPLLNEQVIYTLSYTNQGTESATNVVLYDMVPPALDSASISTTPVHSQVLEGNIYQRNLGTLAPGAGGQIQIVGGLHSSIQGGSIVGNYALITSDIIEDNTENNFADVSLTVDAGSPNMYAQIFAMQSQNVCLGDSPEYIVDIGNDGLQAAQDVVIKTSLPALFNPSFIPQPTQTQASTYWRNINNDIAPGESTAIMITLDPQSVIANTQIEFVVSADGQEDIITVYALKIQDCTTPPNDPIYGCTDSSYDNYNPNATHDNGTCEDDDDTPIYGCTDSSYDNYNPNATHDNGTCEDDDDTPIYGCTDPDATNYNANATHSNGTCTFDQSGDDNDDDDDTGDDDDDDTGDDDDDKETKIYGCTDHSAINYNKDATNNNGTCQFPPDDEEDETIQRVFGCTDHRALNYNAKATHNNGTCRFPKKDEPTITPIYTTNPITPQITASPVPPVIQPIPVVRRNQEGSTECDVVMEDMFVYAKNMGIIGSDSIQDANLCNPIPRMYFAKMLTETVLNLAIPEPALQNRCSFDDIRGLPTDIQFYIRLSCELRLMGVDDQGNPQASFRPNDMVTVAEVAKIFSNILFGDQYNSPDNRYEGHLKAMYDAFLIRSIDEPHRQIRKGHIIKVIQRMDYGNVAQATKYLRWRQNKGN